MTLEQYVRDHGYEVSDLTKEELKEVEKELEAVNRGEVFLDGFFGSYIRKRKGTA